MDNCCIFFTYPKVQLSDFNLKIISYAPQSRRATYPRRLSFQKTHSVVSPKVLAHFCPHSRTVFYKKVLHFNHLSFPIVQF